MKESFVKIFFLLSVSLFFLPLNVSKLSACSGGDDNADDWLYSFFSPELSKGNESFFLHSQIFNTDFTDYSDFNIQEWNIYLNHQYENYDLHKLVYETEASAVDSLIHYHQSKKKILPASLKAFSKTSDKKQLLSSLSYLYFSKLCTPYFESRSIYYWEEDQPIDTLKFLGLIKTAESNFKTNADLFLKQRMGFQLLRLYYNAGNYKQGIDLYKSELSKLNASNSISIRSLGYEASCYYQLKDFAHSNLIYAKMFNEHPENENSALWSFHIEDENDWNNTLALAKTNNDKITLWFFLGYYKDPLRAMKEIYLLDANNEKLKLLMTRAINIEEHYTVDFNKNDSASWYQPYVSNNFDSALTITPLFQFARSICNENKITDKGFWNIAAGHIAYLRNDFASKEKYFATALKENLSNAERAQIRLTSFLELISTADLNEQNENKLYVEFNGLQNLSDTMNMKKNLSLHYAFLKLAKRYAENKDIVKSELCLNQQNETYYAPADFYTDKLATQQMLDFVRNKNKSNWENLLYNNYRYQENSIVVWQAIRLIYEDNFEAALNKLKEDTTDQDIYGDPFIIHPVDCHDCDHGGPVAKDYNRINVLERITHLKYAVDHSIGTIADSAYLLGNALYNLTYYGNTRLIYMNDITTVLGYSDGLGYYGEISNGEFTDKTAPVNIWKMNACKKYYEIAYKASTNSEQKAELCWLLSKCELNDFYNDEVEVPADFDGQIDYVLGPHAHEFKLKYHDTKYYQEVIKECGYFNKMN